MLLLFNHAIVFSSIKRLQTLRLNKFVTNDATEKLAIESFMIFAFKMKSKQPVTLFTGTHT